MIMLALMFLAGIIVGGAAVAWWASRYYERGQKHFMRHLLVHDAPWYMTYRTVRDVTLDDGTEGLFFFQSADEREGLLTEGLRPKPNRDGDFYRLHKSCHKK